MMEGKGKVSRKLKKAAKRILLQTCGSFSWRQQNHFLDSTSDNVTANVANDSADYSSPTAKQRKNSWSWKFRNSEEIENVTEEDPISDALTDKQTLCAICLETLNYSSGNSPGQAVFTAQCSHSFHFSCISSNVSHGSVSCPICRAHWSQLPRNLLARRAIHRVCNQGDPVLQILDNSIATFRVNRRSILRYARYDDDDPIEANDTLHNPRLHLALHLIPLNHLGLLSSSHASPRPTSHHICQTSPESQLSRGSPVLHTPIPANNSPACSSFEPAYLCITLAPQPAMDLVLVASPNGPHLRLLRQSMALVVQSLRPIDRLAIVTYSSSAARVFPLRCMTSYGKRTALQVIDRLFNMGQADPLEGLKKGVKILRDRAHRNPQSCILHLSDNPTRSYQQFVMESAVTVHRFHVGFGFSTPNGFVMHEFEEFLARILGGAIKDVKLRIENETRVVCLAELRNSEERRIRVALNEYGRICVAYSYFDPAVDESRAGDVEIAVGDKEGDDSSGDVESVMSIGRSSGVDSWDYHDPFMARRWAKHLHGCRP
ncbi:hypothetical protein Leryth_018843 [Lithospermum erythrorhizon]|nr:hypothetical protein Leryth_018843 [Lithospermum erythrorhizon]